MTDYIEPLLRARTWLRTVEALAQERDPKGALDALYVALRNLHEAKSALEESWKKHG